MDIGVIKIPIRGEDGKSAYQLAKESGFSGTLAQWLESLKGATGPRGFTGRTGPQGLQGLPGDSTYQLATANGFVGTKQDWYDRFKPEAITSEILKYSKTFVTVWDTTLISVGSSDSNKVRIPLVENGEYDFNIDWGDYTPATQVNSFQEVEHTYEREGIYRIVIRGKIKGWAFDNTGDRLKLIEIQDWGNLELTNTGGYFHGCSNLVITANNIFKAENITNYSNAFLNCSEIERFIGIRYITLIGATNISNMFANTQFNEDVSRFDYSSVTNAIGFLNNANLSTSNYNLLLNSLANQNLQSNVTITVSSNYSSSSTSSRTYIINRFNWTINDEGPV